MITSFSWNQLDTLGFEVIRVVLSVLWQSSVLLGAAGLLVYALRRGSAAIRHRVWAAALLLTPLIPVLTWVGSQTGTPQLHIPIIPAFEVTSVPQTQLPPSGEISATHELKTDASPATDSRQRSVEGNPESRQTAAATEPPISHTGSPARTPRSAHLWGITLIAYTGGLALLLGLVSLGRFRLRRYTREGRIVTNPRLTDVFEAARKQLGIERGCVIVEIDNLHAPLTYRTFHPVIALPHGFTDELSDAELRTIALHELAHIKRHDPLVLNLASIIRAVFFFHPLVWYAAREIATLAEEAADNVVLEATEAPLPYAKMLTRLTEQLTHRMFQTELAVGIVFSKSVLLRRIEAILSPRKNQLQRLSQGTLVMTTLLVFGSLVLATAVPLTHTASTTAIDTHASGMSVRHVWEVDPASTVYPSGISRDGRYVSYVDWTAGNLAIRDLKTGTSRMVTKNTTWGSTGGWAEESVISPDGKRIAYHWFVEKDGENIFTLRVSDMDGSNMRILHQDKNAPWARPFDWSPDGESLLVYFTHGENIRTSPDTPSALALVAVSDGTVTTLKEWRGRRWPRIARFSPDGKHIAFDFGATNTPEPKDIFTIELSSGREVALVEHPANDEFLGWMPDGKGILFASDRTSVRGLWTIEVSNGRPVGSPVLLKRDFAGEPVGFTTDGSYYFGRQTTSWNVFVATLDESGTDFKTAPQYASSRFVHSTSSSDWSPDGKSLAFKARLQDKAESSAIAIYSAATGLERIVEPSPGLAFIPMWRKGPVQWSPDGRALYVAATRLNGDRGIFRIELSTGAAQLVIAHDDVRNPLPTPDGKAVYFRVGWRSLFRHDLTSGDEDEIYQSTLFIDGLDLSPDGNWIAILQGGDSIVVMSADGGEPREVVHLDEAELTLHGRRFVTWTPDGKHLLFSKRSREIWRVNVETGRQQQIGPKIPGLYRATMHPDGKRIAFTTFQKSSELWMMENFLP